MKKYAICGVSNRAIGSFIGPLIKTYGRENRIVAMLDIDPKRFDYCASRFPETKAIPAYGEDQFAEMIADTKPDTVIVTSKDSTHARYIIQALQHDLNVITEKPMAISAEQCRDIIEAERKSKGTVTVAFNYRYNPYSRRIRELVLEGKIGKITSVDLNWYVDTHHGSSYFKRWNRKRDNSGGLSIHKSTHHFDLVNWWIGQKPVEVFAYGALNYFGPDSEMNPKKEDGRYCETCDVKLRCPYVMRWTTRSKEIVPPDDHLTAHASSISDRYTDYRTDACIFDSEIDIEDTYTTTVRYDQGALLSYSINFSTPYEGYRLAINGTKGRIETQEYHGTGRIPYQVPEQTIDYFPLFGAKETIYVVKREGGHGGGDPVLFEDLFLGPDPARGYEILAGAQAGAYSVALGEGVWRSVKEHRPVPIRELLGNAY